MIDNHCHPFDVEEEPFDLFRVAIDLGEPSDPSATDSRGEAALLFWRSLLRSRVAARLGVEDQDLESARTAAATDYASYVAGLFAEVGFTDLIMDPSWPSGSTKRLADFGRLSGCRIHPLVRLEAVVDPMVSQGAEFGEIRERFDEALSEGVDAGNRGLKTVVAYRTGLGIDPNVSEMEARSALAGDWSAGQSTKPLRDLLVVRALEFAVDQDLPVQIHTGFGDSDIRLQDSNPLLLEDLLRTPVGSEAQIVLLHSGFPFQEEAAFLAASHSNVHIDVSLVGVFVPTALTDTLVKVVGMVPPERVLVGTDAYGPPELFWFAATMLQESWEHASARFKTLGVADGWLERTREAVFDTNARRLYRLDELSP